MSTGAAFPIDSSPPPPPVVSLVTSSTVIEHGEADREWMNGVAWTPENCEPPDEPIYWACPDPGGAEPAVDKDVPSQGTQRLYRPFDIWNGLHCTTFGFRSNAPDFNARASRNLLRWQSRFLESEFWLGTAVTLASFENEFLDDGTATVVNSGTDTNIVTGLAELEQALGECLSGPGMIHAQPRVVTAWASRGLVIPSASGRQLRTHLGNTVVPGVGYPGTRTATLDPATPAHSVAFATGMVTIHLGPIRNEAGPALAGAGGLAADQVERSINDIFVRAERAAVVIEDGCCKFAALVDLTLEYGNT